MIAALLVAGAIVVLNWPTLLINATTLDIAARHLAPLGVHVEWEEVSTSMHSHGFMDETLGISFDHPCLEARPVLEKACFAKVEVHARYIIEGFIPKVIGVGPVAIEGGDVVVRLPEDDAREPEKKGGEISLPTAVLPGWLANMDLRTVSVAIDSAEIHRGRTTYRGKLEAKAIPGEDKGFGKFGLTATVDEAPAGRKLEVDATAASPSGFLKEDWSVQAHAKAGLSELGSATLDAEVAMSNARILDHEVKLVYAGKGLNIDGTLKGALGERSLETELRASVRGISEIVPAVELPRCSVKLISTDVQKNRGRFSLSCPVDVRLKRFSLPDELKQIYKPPDRIHVDIASSANTFFLPDMDQKIDGTLNVRLEPTTSRLVDTRGRFTVAFTGKPSTPLKAWNIQTDVDIDFVIREFKKLVSVLNATRWKVPAPFNVLAGSIELSLEGRLSTLSELGSFPVKLATRLRSTKQVIDIDGEGELRFGFAGKAAQGADVEADITLVDVQLQLPNVALAGIPRFTPDGRIILNPGAPKEEKKRDVPFNYRIHVATREGSPARVLSNLTPKFIPITADVVIENGGVSGTAALTTFPVTFFNRTATLDKLDIDFKEPMDTSTVDGSLSYEFPELKAMVVIKGPFASPKITLESKPPMPPGDVLATIVYGEPLDKIDSDQADSVSNMNAAMTSNALALTSFVLLGSTPIQGVTYDPSTGVFSARVRLAKKTSLVVGTGGGTQQAMVRQRLGHGFSISAGADKSPDDDQTAGTAYIEWSKRF